MKIDYLVYSNILMLIVFFFQMIVKYFLKNKEDISELRGRLKSSIEQAEKIPKMREDLNNAHEKIRKLEQMVYD